MSNREFSEHGIVWKVFEQKPWAADDAERVYA
jgi:hypothetical protein